MPSLVIRGSGAPRGRRRGVLERQLCSSLLHFLLAGSTASMLAGAAMGARSTGRVGARGEPFEQAGLGLLAVGSCDPWMIAQVEGLLAEEDHPRVVEAAGVVPVLDDLEVGAEEGEGRGDAWPARLRTWVYIRTSLPAWTRAWEMPCSAMLRRP